MFKRSALGTSYWIAFVILAIWASFAYYTMHTMINSQQKYGTLINLSGKQRMLSQRTALYAQLSYKGEAELQTLRPLIRLMKDDHDFITSNLTSPTLYAHYFGAGGLDQQVRAYFGLLDAYVSRPQKAELEAIIKANSPLLANLNEAVTLFEQENNGMVANLERQEKLIYLGTLLTLLFEALIIVFPILRLHKRYLIKLEEEVALHTDEIRIFANIFEHSKEGMVIADARRIITNVNHAFTQITGFSKEEAIGRPIHFRHSGRHDPEFYRQMWKAITEEQYWQGEIINLAKDGRELHEEHTIMKLIDGNVNYVSVFSDVSERVFYERELHYMANHDSLTGLLNRSEIINRIDHAISLADRNDEALAVIFVDLDNFKMINDSLGHTIGDRVLIEVARRLSNSVRESDTLGRLGGDEFVVLVEALKRPGDEKAVLNKLLAHFESPLDIEGKSVAVSASMGVIYYPDGERAHCSSQQLIRKADIAMYRAKESGKKQIAHYDEALEEKIQSQIMVKNRLEDAIDHGGLELHFQPKIELANGKIAGAEALLRWCRNGQLIPPRQFIAIAEENDLIKQIDLWVVREVIESLSSKFSDETITVALNISGKTFADKDAMDTILELIINSGLASRIEFEITERVLIENLLFASETVTKIKAAGVTVSLDDFGTGYSSFSYLSKIPLDVIKIDQTFIGSLNEPKQKILVESIMAFAGKLGMKVIAEGIETPEQHKWLKAHHCDYGQGFLFSRPLPYEAFEKLLAS